MKNRLIFVFLLFAGMGSVQAQRNEVVGAGGDFIKNGNGSISWTLGELAIETYAVSGKVLTQGFHQTRLSVLATGLEEPLDFKIAVYPNPTEDRVHLYAENPEGITYRLYDLVGQTVDQQSIAQSETTISLSGLAPAMYLLEVRRGAAILRMFRIIKK